MSYGITLLPRAPGQDWDELLAANEEAEDRGRSCHPVPDATRETWTRIVDQVRELLPNCTSDVAHLELEIDDPDSGIWLRASNHDAGVAMPYWYGGNEADRISELLMNVVRVVGETAFDAYDPHLGRGVFETDAGAAGSGSASVLREQRAFLDHIESGDVR